MGKSVAVSIEYVLIRMPFQVLKVYSNGKYLIPFTCFGWDIPGTFYHVNCLHTGSRLLRGSYQDLRTYT
ncbi:hypothetical protein [Chitinophaga eiseniae]|uniref:Uncharacterized protein n=1 Tax=Chitinophaga eiseniae TaxID=634771 RepID=A0A847SCZ6_9BACT|nr:hypothetical protein [Chitinophaga eiseniae]NLR77613.1 hypothetical protein [Chitinophaga eiseniae]